ncbi:MAG TPA: HNH endonuclease, partial [Marmoricola sp.]
RGREVVLHAHLSAEALRSGDRDSDVPVWVTGAGGWAGGQLLTAAQVAQWCGLADTTRVTVKPVVDLNTVKTVDGYRVPDWLAEQVRLRDRTCVFPYCTRPARACDLDHVIPFDEGGTTSSDNLACLCRLHHRMKTHGGWTYQMLTLGTYLWHGPHGHTWLRDASGTTDLTPPEPDPPASDPPERRTS